MDVSLRLLRWFDLDNQVNVWDVKASGSHIGSTEHSELAFFEALHRDFSLVLSDISVHDFNVLLDLVRQDQRVAVSLGLGEDDRLSSVASVANQDVCQRCDTVLEWAADGEMLDVLGRLVLEILAQIYHSEVLLHMVLSHVSDPPRDGCGEETNLNIVLALLVDRRKNLEIGQAKIKDLLFQHLL